MRFVTIMGLTLIAGAINENALYGNKTLFFIITICALITDVIDCYKRWNKTK